LTVKENVRRRGITLASSRLLEFFETQVVVMRLAIARGSAMNDHAVAAFAAIPLSEAKRWTAPSVDAFVMRGQGSATSRPAPNVGDRNPVEILAGSQSPEQLAGQKSFNYDL